MQPPLCLRVWRVQSQYGAELEVSYWNVHSRIRIVSTLQHFKWMRQYTTKQKGHTHFSILTPKPHPFESKDATFVRTSPKSGLSQSNHIDEVDTNDILDISYVLAGKVRTKLFTLWCKSKILPECSLRRTSSEKPTSCKRENTIINLAVKCLKTWMPELIMQLRSSSCQDIMFQIS